MRGKTETRMKALSACHLAFITVSIACGALRAQADLPAMLGGGNIGLHADADKMDVLQALGAGLCRVPAGGSEYWKDGKPQPERFDAVVLAAHAHGLTPVFLFEYYTRWNEELGGPEKWRAIGRAFAERFHPGSAWLLQQQIQGW